MGRLRGRARKPPTLEKARLLLLRRRIARWLPRGSGRALLGLVVILVLAGAVAAAANAIDRAGPLGRVLSGTTAALGFVVESVQVEGRALTPRPDILRALGVARGTAILAVDPSRARNQLESLPWVRQAVVERRLPDTLFVHLDERQPLALWQHHGQIALVDQDGVVVTTEHLGRYNDLLMVVGDGAPQNTAALLKVLDTDKGIESRVAAAVWVGERRWTLHMDNGIEIDLPEANAAAAYDHLRRMAEEHGLLARDIARVDLRFPDRVLVTLAADRRRPADDPAKAAKAPAKAATHAKRSDKAPKSA